MIILQATQEQLLTAMNAVAGIVERRHTMPILSNVLIRKQNDEFELTSSDLEIQIRTTAQLGGDEGEYSTTVGARKLIEILKTLPNNEKVILESKSESQGDRLILRAGKNRFTLQTLPSDGFPLVREAPMGEPFHIPMKQFKRLLAQVAYAMGVNDVRHYLNGVLFSVNDHQLHVVATDGHRLAYTGTTLENKIEHQQDVILPRKAVLELQKMLSDDGNIEIQFASNQAKFLFKGKEFVTKLIDGKFPDYNRVIPRNNHNIVQMGRQALIDSLQRAAVMTSDKFKGVRLNLENGLLRFTSSNTEHEEANIEIDVEYNLEPIDSGFNVDYLLAGLQAMQHDQVRLEFLNHEKPVLITSIEDANFKYVVMPLKV